MSEKLINQSTLAKIVGTTPVYISKLVKKGIFDHCYEGDDLMHFEAIEAYVQNYDFTRDSQREANSKNKDTSKLFITKKDLALAFLLKSANEITRLNKLGIFEECYDGKKLKRVPALKAYVDYISNKDKPSNNEISPAKENDSIDDNVLKAQTVQDIREFYDGLIKLAKSPAQKANIAKEEDVKIEKFLKNKELEKRLVDTAVVEAEAFEMARKVRDSFLSLPDRLSSELVGKDKREIQQVLLKEINYVLEVLADD